jgi:D-alanine-D-alanine ligase
MKIGLSYDLKSDPADDCLLPANLPDDWQEEFDSPGTIDAIASVLQQRGHQVAFLGDGRELIDKVLADPPDLVFNFAEGQGIGRSREARVPAFLEMLGIPYTGSDPLTLAATLDKDCARRLVRSAGGVIPPGFVAATNEDVLELLARHCPAFPLIVKPAWEGSSKGIRRNCLVHSPDELTGAVERLRCDHRQPVLVEEFIQGDELTVGVVGNEPPQIIGIMRVLPVEPTDHFLYSLEIKRDFRKRVHYESPPALPADIQERVVEATLLAWGALGCRDFSRFDFRLRGGIPYFLEVNPLPGLNPESSDLVILAGLQGWSYDQLIVRILDAAVERVKQEPAGRTNPGSPEEQVAQAVGG